MKKVLKNRVFIFVLGVIVSSSITSVAYSLNSSDVGFTPENSEWEVSNVEEAVNDLYDSTRVDIMDKLLFTSTNSASYGYRLSGRNASLTLDKGNYIIISSIAYNAHHATSAVGGFMDLSDTFISYNNGTCTDISKKYIYGGATSTYANSMYMTVGHYVMSARCNFTDTATVVATSNLSTYAGFGGTVYVEAIKLD